jgi:CHAT domain-containing protein/Tfp pilus assembly protein PilF
MIEVLNSIASIYSEMGSIERANETYLRAIEIATTVDQPQDEASCRMNLAGNYRMQQRFKEALSQLDATKPLLDRQPEPIKTALFYQERGLSYLGMGELDNARDDLLAYLEQAKQLDDPFYQIDAMINLGYLYQEIGAFEQSRAVAEQARPLAEDTGNGRLMRGAYVLAATAEQSLGNFEEALVQRRFALDIDKQEEAVPSIVEDEMSIASLYAALGENEKARSTFYGTLETIHELGRKDLEWVLHLGVAHSFEKENPDSAVYHYERALSLVEASRTAIGGAETRTGFLTGERRFFYEEVARYYASLGTATGEDQWHDRAFVTMERAKARGLLDLLERPALMESTPAEDAMLDSLYRIEANTPEEKEDQRRLEERYVALRNSRLDESVGKLAQDTDVSGLETIQKALPKKTALLEYALGDTVSLLWVVDRKGFEFHELPNRKTLAQQIQRLRDAVGQPGSGDAALRKTARELYMSLVLPAEERIGEAETLVIVPDGALFELPFEVLLTEEPGEDVEWGGQPFLARSYNTAYAPSASVFAKIRQSKKRKYDFDLLAIGDPNFDDASALEPLPYTRTEIENITSFADVEKNRIYLSDRATETALKRELRTETPRLLHLATHGLVDPADPSASSVAFTPDPESGEDGYLYTLEILSLPFDVGIVVLSACESARGRVQRGEGVVGLSRAFMAAGSRGVVASLWAVSDESTAVLMSAFYERMLGKKKPAAEALKTARLALIEDADGDSPYAHPFYWSPFIVIGAADKTPW